MRESLAFAALALVLLSVSEAAGQTSGQGSTQVAPPSAAAAALAAQAGTQTSYLLALYMAQLATKGTPPSQSDIDEATRQYFTNGAAVTGIPASGPAAAYFHNGSNGWAYAPMEAGPRSAPSAEDAGSPAEVAPAPTAAPASPAAETESAAEAGTEASPASGSPCATHDEVAAAIAIASQCGSATPSAPTTAGGATTSLPPLPPPAPAALETMATTRVSSQALECPPAPSLASRVALVFGGALLGGLAVLLWARPRPLRVLHRR